MTNLEKYKDIFNKSFTLDIVEVNFSEIEYQSIPQWDSVGHMSLITNLEEAFEIMLDDDDIIAISSFEKGKEILSRYNVTF